MASRTYIRYIYLSALLSAVWILSASCSADPSVYEPDTPPAGAVLRLSTGSVFTRAGGDAGHRDDETDIVADPYSESSEELIDRVDLFFFDSETSTDAPPFYIHEITALNKTTAADLTVKVPIENIGKFGGANEEKKVYIYALVNLPSEITVDTGENTITPASVPATLNNLHGLKVVTGEFAPSGAGAEAAVPSSFVMRGGNTVELQEGSDAKLAYVKGTIELERLASKIRLWADIPDYIYVDTETGLTVDASRKEEATVEMWKPVLKEGASNSQSDAVKLYIYNIAQGGIIDGRLSEVDDFKYSNVARADSDQESVARRLVTGDALNESLKLKDNENNETEYKYSHNIAYYSYPNQWDSSSPSEQHQTYIILTMPWAKVDKSDPGAMPEEYDVYYYQIPVNALNDPEKEDSDRLDPNRYYRIKLKVGMLGSKDLGSALPVEASWEVVPWRTADVDVSIKPRRYLVVNQKEWVMNNVWTLEIPFSTSHPTEVEECYVTYFRYNDIWGKDANSLDTHNATEFTAWLTAADANANVTRRGEGFITAENFQTGLDIEPEISVKSGWGWTTNRFGVPVYANITTTTNITYQADVQNVGLYYKSEYFYDKYLDQLAYVDGDQNGNGYSYYVGHEHPKTFQEDYIAYNENKLIGTDEISLQDQKDAWDMYMTKYKMDSVYTYTIDPVKNVIVFKHPLVLWEEVRTIENSSKKDYTQTSEGTPVWNGFNYTQNVVENVIKYKTNKLHYYTPVINKRTGNLWDEFSRCEIVIKLKHSDWKEKDDLYRETIHITQYPGMYISVSHNYGEVSDGEDNKVQNGNKYVKVNGHGYYEQQNGNSGNQYHTNRWDVVNFLGDFAETSSNSNPNMYLIHTTQLSEEFQGVYELGDPRTIYVNNDLATYPGTNNEGNVPTTANDDPLKDEKGGTKEETFVKWKGWNMSGKTYYEDDLYKGGLSYYYPTDETVSDGSKENFIAPVFRIASSYGKVAVNGRTSMRRRCAAYQEAGRPAGRWRLPTKAEIKYIATLSAEGKIPILFGSTISKTAPGYYWSANGGLAVTGNASIEDTTGDPNNGYVPGVMAARCVYDEWYWTKIDGGDFPSGYNALTEDFYWGDRPKDNTQTQSILQRVLNKKEVIAIDE